MDFCQLTVGLIRSRGERAARLRVAYPTGTTKQMRR